MSASSHACSLAVVGGINFELTVEIYFEMCPPSSPSSLFPCLVLCCCLMLYMVVPALLIGIGVWLASFESGTDGRKRNGRLKRSFQTRDCFTDTDQTTGMDYYKPTDDKNRKQRGINIRFDKYISNLFVSPCVVGLVGSRNGRKNFESTRSQTTLSGGRRKEEEEEGGRRGKNSN